MSRATEPPATSNALLDQKIAELERRLQGNRRLSKQRSHALVKGIRDSFTSPLALLIAAGTGFAAHRFDLLHRPKPDSNSPAATGASDSLLDGMIRAFSLAATVVALLPDAAPSPADEAATSPRA